MHVISQEGVSPDDEKVVSWPIPTSTQEVERFLGFANCYRRFIRDFSAIAKPLHHLMEQGVIFKWNDTLSISIQKTPKLSQHTTFVLAFPDFSREFILDTDASECGLEKNTHKLITMGWNK